MTPPHTPPATSRRGYRHALAQLVAQLFTTLDGVVQAPGDRNEDRSGGFSHGGWHLAYFEPRSQAWVIDTNARAAAYLYGRPRTTCSSTTGRTPPRPTQDPCRR